MFWLVALVPMVILMFATIPWQLKLEPPILRSLFIPAMMVLYCIPVIFSSRRLGKRLEQIRNEENTATPLRSILAGQQKSQGATTRLFVGSGLLVAFWPTLTSFMAGDLIGVVSVLLSAALISFAGAMFCGENPTRAFRTYAFTLAAISLVGIGMTYFRRELWSDAVSNHSFWLPGTMMAMVTTHIILTVIIWRRVYGKPA